MVRETRVWRLPERVANESKRYQIRPFVTNPGERKKKAYRPNDAGTLPHSDRRTPRHTCSGSDGVAKKGRVIDMAALELAFISLLKKMIAGFGPCDLYWAQR